MNSYFEQSGFYGQGVGGTAGTAPDYRFPIGLGGLGGVTAYGQHQAAARPGQDPTAGYESPASPSKSSLYSSLSDPSSYRKSIRFYSSYFFLATMYFPFTVKSIILLKKSSNT